MGSFKGTWGSGWVDTRQVEGGGKKHENTKCLTGFPPPELAQGLILLPLGASTCQTHGKHLSRESSIADNKLPDVEEHVGLIHALSVELPCTWNTPEKGIHKKSIAVLCIYICTTFCMYLSIYIYIYINICMHAHLHIHICI